MHFDEVYHPRTAIEFLQDWRYGLSHDIYEWTHPHLAKYVMAGGLVAWGDDRTTATSDLGVPVKAAVIEPRWDETRPRPVSRAIASGSPPEPRFGPMTWPPGPSSSTSRSLAPRPSPSTRSVTRQLSGRTAARSGSSTRRCSTRPAGQARRRSTCRRGRFMQTDAAVQFLHVTPDGGTIVAVEPGAPSAPATSADDAIVIDSATAAEVGRVDHGDRRPGRRRGHGHGRLRHPAGRALPRHDDRPHHDLDRHLGSGDGHRLHDPARQGPRVRVGPGAGRPARHDDRRPWPRRHAPDRDELRPARDVRGLGRLRPRHADGPRPGHAARRPASRRSTSSSRTRTASMPTRSTPTPACRSRRARSSSTRTSAIRPATGNSSWPSATPARSRPSTSASTPSPGGCPASSRAS